LSETVSVKYASQIISKSCLSDREIAEATNIPLQTINRWRREVVKKIRVAYLDKLAYSLGANIVFDQGNLVSVDMKIAHGKKALQLARELFGRLLAIYQDLNRLGSRTGIPVAVIRNMLEDYFYSDFYPVLYIERMATDLGLYVEFDENCDLVKGEELLSNFDYHPIENHEALFTLLTDQNESLLNITPLEEDILGYIASKINNQTTFDQWLVVLHALRNLKRIN
jgi:hypothetical protein